MIDNIKTQMWYLTEGGPEQFVKNCQGHSADFWYFLRKISVEKELLVYNAARILSENQRLQQSNGAIYCTSRLSENSCEYVCYLCSILGSSEISKFWFTMQYSPGIHEFQITQKSLYWYDMY